MNSQWKTFLSSRSAQIDDSDAVRFTGAPLDADCALVDLSYLGLISVDGADAAEFLQGQLTNDVRALTPARSQISSLCSPKGRMLAAFRMLRLGDTFYLQLPRVKLAATLQRLRMFVLRAKVALGDASDALVAIGLTGHCAEGLLAPHVDALPREDNAVARSGDLTAIRIPGTIPRFQVLGPARAMEAIWTALAAAATPLGSDYWRLLDIRAGLPSVWPETSDAFVPQMANLQLVGGVSFTKGCYTGQEVVARMQYLGKLKRRMYLAEIAHDAPLAPGQALLDGSTQPVGKVVDAQRSGADRWELLAVIGIDAAEDRDVGILLDPDGSRVKVAPPPYGFATD
jgi:folate-binding protein YgfZ